MGHIINVCSTTTDDICVNGSVYYSTKATVEAYTQAARQDFADTPVRFTNISPGLVDPSREGGRDSMPYMAMDPQDIADQVIYAATRPFHMQVADLSSYSTHQMNTGNGRDRSHSPIRIMDVNRSYSPMRYMDTNYDMPHHHPQMQSNMISSSPAHGVNVFSFPDHGPAPPRQSEMSGNRSPFNNYDRPGTAEKAASRPGMMSSDEWAKNQRELMIKQREIMLSQPSRAWADKPRDARDNMIQQSHLRDASQHGSHMPEKNPFIVNFEVPPHMKMPGMGGGGCPFFMGNMANSCDKGSPGANNRSLSPMNYHPFGVHDASPCDSYDMRPKQQHFGW